MAAGVAGYARRVTMGALLVTSIMLRSQPLSTQHRHNGWLGRFRQVYFALVLFTLGLIWFGVILLGYGRLDLVESGTQIFAPTQWLDRFG